MSISLYDFSIPALIRGLTNMSAILDKAIAHATAKKIESATLAQLRLFPDMHPLSRQVQIACDTAKGAAGRLAAVEIPKHEDTETTLPELKARIAKTVVFIQTVSAEQIDGSEEREITLTAGGQELSFKGMPYLIGFALPNFYFHLVTAYNILRHNGVDIGKRDFMGKL